MYTQLFICILSFFIFFITISPPVHADTIPIDIIAENPNGGSGWQLEEPGFVVVATPDELPTVRHLLQVGDYQKIQAVDYDQFFIVAIFHGSGCGLIPDCDDNYDAQDIEIDQIDRHDALVQITSHVNRVPLNRVFWGASTYIVVKMPKDESWDREGTFSLTHHETTVITKTHYIPSDRLSFETIAVAPSDSIKPTPPIWTSEELGLRVGSAPDDLVSIQAAISEDAWNEIQSIDYDKQFVIVLMQGLKETTGYGIEAERIRHRKGEIYVEATIIEPTADAQTENTLTSPYHIVRVDKQPWWAQEQHVIILHNGNQILTQTHNVPHPRLEIENIYKISFSHVGFWPPRTPGFVAINTSRDAFLLDYLSHNRNLNAIDYGKYFVTALFHGGRGSTGYHISIEEARQDANHLWIDGYAESPFYGEGSAPAESYPYHIVKIRRADTVRHPQTIVDVFFNGTKALTQTHHIAPSSQLISLDSGVESGWEALSPHMTIIADPNDIDSVQELIPTTALESLNALDYSQHYAILVFQGQKSSNGSGIEVQAINRLENRVMIESVTTKPSAHAHQRGAIETSSYHLVQVDRLYENGREIEFILSLDGQHVLTQTQTITDPYVFMTIERESQRAGWTEQDPHLVIITNANEIDVLANWVSPQALTALHDVDYNQSYVVAVFQGMKPTTDYGIEVYRLSHEGTQMVIHTAADWPYKFADSNSIPQDMITSPYHLIAVNRPSTREMDPTDDEEMSQVDEVEFVLAINSKVAMTRTHVIANAGEIVPLTDSPIYLPIIAR
ncbi:MAG: protease complex subunit PrcB family protein [Chloroflexota bacterium]